MILTLALNHFLPMAPQLHQVAQDDTPSIVDVPNGWSGLLLWVAGRFGGAAIIAIACGWALTHLYEDQKKIIERLTTILETRATVDAQTSSSNLQLKMAIEDIAKEARLAHRQ